MSITVSEGVDKVVATETISSVEYQKVKLIDATAASTTGTGIAANPLQVSLANTGANATAVVVSAASLPLPTGAATAAKQPALGTAGTASADVITIQGIASMTAVKVDGSAVTQPVSIATNTPVGNVAHDAADSGAPIKVGGRAVNAELAAVANNDRADFVTDLTGKQIVLPYANPENLVYGSNASAITDTTSTSIVAAQGAGVRFYCTALTVTNSHATVGTLVKITDGSGGTLMWQGYCAAAGGGFSITLPSPIKTTANTALHAVCGTTGSSIYVSASGYKGA